MSSFNSAFRSPFNNTQSGDGQGISVKEVVEGDSNTEGFGAIPYSTQGQVFLSPLNSYVYQNIATAGISPAVLNSNYATRAGNKLDSTKDINILSYLAGTNTSGASDDEANEKYVLIRSYLNKAIVTGYNRIAVGTYFSRSDNPGYWGLQLVRMNQLIRTYWDTDLNANAVFDFAANPNFDSSFDANNLTNYHPDKLHLTTAGQALLTPTWASQVNSILDTSPPILKYAPVLQAYGVGNAPLLSNGNRTLAMASGFGFLSPYIPMLRKAGKYYWEVDIVGRVSTNIIGISSSSMNTGAGPFGNSGASDSLGWSQDGNVRINNVVVAAIGLLLAVGDTARVAMDLDTRKVWFSRRRASANSNWNNDPSANPETGVNGIDISGLAAITAPLRGGVSIYAVGDILTLRSATPELSTSVPVGFSAYGGASSTTSPAITQAPVISGTGAQGSTLTVSTPATASGTNSPNISYQLRRNGAVVDGGTGLTYVLATATTGDIFDVVATAMSIGGEVTSSSNSIVTA